MPSREEGRWSAFLEDWTVRFLWHTSRQHKGALADSLHDQLALNRSIIRIP